MQPKSSLHYHRRFRFLFFTSGLGEFASFGIRALGTLKCFEYYSGNSSDILSNKWMTTWIFEDSFN